MTPLTRKENYLNEIVGWGNTAPEKPLTPEELFFAAILGEAVQVPEPLTRYQMYLAKIAGRDIEIPTPITRLEYFLAKAAGMDITVPVPITREEIYWSNYTAIVEFEVENVPPLTYKAIEGTLKNYRIYGNTVSGESVGNIVTDSQSEHYGKYAIPVTTNSETANIYLDEPLRKVGDEAEYVDYETQKWHRVRKNLLQNTATSQTINGVTFTVNEDGSVTCNGTASANAMKNINLVSFKLNNFILNGCPTGGGWETFQFDIIQAQSPYPVLYRDVGTGVSVDTLNENVYFRIRIASGYTCNNLTFFPMIRLATIEDDTYEPYIADTELDVTLPALPTIKGTNVLSVGTAVQPSKVYVKYEGARE